MLWLNSSRERIKSENPGISITEISKKAGEMWRQLTKDEKEVSRKNMEEPSLVSLCYVTFNLLVCILAVIVNQFHPLWWK